MISDRLAVFPGDVPFSRTESIEIGGNSSFALSSIRSTVHLGAHVDSPSHYQPNGLTMENVDLLRYLGPAQVISVRSGSSTRIAPHDLEIASVSAPRVLLRTRSFPNPESWNGDFKACSSELIHFLADRGVMLVGIDTPSIDPSDDKILESHKAVAERKMSILEGIVLDSVPDGIYTLVALPLRIEGADASPVRAVLLGGKVQMGGAISMGGPTA